MLDRFAEHAVERPEPSQGASLASSSSDIAGQKRPLQRRPEVVDVAAKPIQPRQLLVAADLDLTLVGKVDVKGSVPLARVVGVRVGEDIEGVGAKGVKKAIPVVAGTAHHRLLDQGGD